MPKQEHRAAPSAPCAYHASRACVGIADVKGRHPDRGLALEVIGHERLRGAVVIKQAVDSSSGAPVDVVAPAPQDIPRAVEGPQRKPRQHNRPEFVEAKFELGHSAEVAAAADSPQQVIVGLSLAVTTVPSASTIVAEIRLSQVRPCL